MVLKKLSLQEKLATFPHFAGLMKSYWRYVRRREDKVGAEGMQKVGLEFNEPKDLVEDLEEE